MQQLNVNLSIPVPEDYVIISKVEFEELKQQKLNGVYWNMKDLKAKVNKKSSQWIEENILYSTRFRKMLDYKNGGFVFYPEGKGREWSFHALRMAQFLDKYFSDIFLESVKKKQEV